MQEKQQSASWRKQTLYAQISSVTGHRWKNSSTTTMKPTKKSDDDSLLQMKLWEKAKSGSFQHHNNCGSTNCFLRESRHVGVSGTDNDEQSLNNSASVLHLWLLEEFSWFQNGRILLASKINAEPSIHNWGLMILKTLTFADDCKRSYL